MVFLTQWTNSDWQDVQYYDGLFEEFGTMCNIGHPSYAYNWGLPLLMYQETT